MAKCIHHWYMGASNASIVRAKCLKCGAEKDYSNSPVSKSGAVNKIKEDIPEAITIE